MGQFSCWVVFLRAICPRGNYVGNKSSERQSSSGAISRGILSGGNYFWSSCPGVIIQGQSSRGQLSWGQYSSGAIVQGGNFPRGQLSVGQLSSGAIVRGAIILGGNCPDTLWTTPSVQSMFGKLKDRSHLFFSLRLIAYIHGNTMISKYCICDRSKNTKI